MADWKEESSELLNELASKLANLLRDDSSTKEMLEFKVGFVKGSKIEIRPRDHNPPHFHVDYAGKQASYSIETGELLRGRLPNSANKAVKNWYSDNKNGLADLWNNSRPGQGYIGEGYILA